MTAIAAQERGLSFELLRTKDHQGKGVSFGERGMQEKRINKELCHRIIAQEDGGFLFFLSTDSFSKIVNIENSKCKH